VHAHVPLLPSGIIWCQPVGGDARRLERFNSDSFIRLWLDGCEFGFGYRTVGPWRRCAFY